MSYINTTETASGICENMNDLRKHGTKGRGKQCQKEKFLHRSVFLRKKCKKYMYVTSGPVDV